MKRKAFLLFILISALLVSCAGAEIGTQKRPPLRVEYTQWWGDYTLLIAQKQGLFQKYNVDVELVYYEDFNKSLPEFAAGYLDVGLFAIGDVLNISAFTPVKVVAVYDIGGTNDVVAAPEIRTVLDLNNKTIGVPMGTPYELYILEMLREAGVRSSNVKFVNVPPDKVLDALPTKIQAGYVWEPYTSEAIKKGYHLLSSSGNISGLFPDVITFRKSVVDDRPEDVRAFLQAWFEAVEFRNNNPDRANQIIADSLNLPLSQINGNARILNLEENKAIFSKTPPQGLRSILETAKLNAEFLLRIGTLNSLPDYNSILTDEFLE